jgi:hypothetical protein
MTLPDSPFDRGAIEEVEPTLGISTNSEWAKSVVCSEYRRAPRASVSIVTVAIKQSLQGIDVRMTLARDYVVIAVGGVFRYLLIDAVNAIDPVRATIIVGRGVMRRIRVCGAFDRQDPSTTSRIDAAPRNAPMNSTILRMP